MRSWNPPWALLCETMRNEIDMLLIFLLYVRTAKRILTADHGP